MVIITGAAGFIGSCLLRKLNDEGVDRICLVDDFSRADKLPNLERKNFTQKIHRDEFSSWFLKNAKKVSFVFHMGARTDTTEQDKTIFDQLNLNYSKLLWVQCSQSGIPFIYASSAATYGAGELGYDDDHVLTTRLKPLNPYGLSKNQFDLWALSKSQDNSENSSPPYWAGLKFFNVYGPNEYHKSRMASVVYHAYQQMKLTGEMKLFRSHRAGISNGQQSRDFVYVKDVVDVCWFLYNNKVGNGLYNVGTGKARSFSDLATETFRAMEIVPIINFIDTPADIRETYQYFTQANIDKLRNAGYLRPFTSLGEGITDYVTNFLSKKIYW